MAKALHGPVSLSKSALLLSPCIRWASGQSQWFDESKVDATDTVKRDKGTEFHTRIHQWSSNIPITTEYIHQDIDLWMEHATVYLQSVLLPRCESFMTEVAVGINWVTNEAEVFPEAKNRNYPDRPGWQFGTADIVAVLKTGELLVADWKTGGNDGATEQLLSLASGFRIAMPTMLGPPDGTSLFHRPIRILCLQVNEHGVWPHEDSVTDAQMEAHWDAMRFQWEDVGKRNDPVPGIHCTALYCPHLAYCPAITGIVEESALVPPKEASGMAPLVTLHRKHKMTDKPTSNEGAGFVMARITAAKRQMKYWEESLKDYVTKSGGKVTQGLYEWGPGNNGWRWRKQ